jgi:hypothetical protein
MSAQQLPPHDFRRLVGLLKNLDAFRTRRERQAFLESVFVEYEDRGRLIRALDLNGAAAVVAEIVVRELERQCVNERPALVPVALELLRRVSVDAGDRSFLERLAAGTPPRPDVAARPEPSRRPSSSVERFDFSRSERKRLFFLHSHATPDEVTAVRKLADSFRARDQFDVVLDLDRDVVDRGWNVWASNQYEEADFIVISATREWCHRFNEFFRAERPERYSSGMGVFFEANLINNDIGRGMTRRIMLVFHNEDDDQYLHPTLRLLNRFSWPADEAKLTRVLLGTPAVRDTTSDGRSRFAFALPSTPSREWSRLPIVVAIEHADEPLTEDVLLGTERHMTVTLRAAQIEGLERATKDLASGVDSIESIADIGAEVWRTLDDAQPRLRGLLERAGEHGHLQPVAWTGFTDLLLRLHRAISIANLAPGPDPSGFISVRYGAHYFSPITRTPVERMINARLVASSSVGGAARPITTRTVSTSPDAAVPLDLSLLRGVEVAIVSGPSVAPALESVTAYLEAPQAAAPVARVVFAFGEGPISSEHLDKLMAQVPCVSVGGPELRSDELIAALHRSTGALAGSFAIPSIVASIRSEWIRFAVGSHSLAALVDGILWTTWSWIGRPLFTSQFGELPAPSYPHLMDLRSIASSGWYHERREGVPECYQAAALVRRDAAGDDAFHLYLSGAGGTGKSCFLRNVYETLADRADVLAVWHRVDRPSSEWQDVERRLKEECAAALRRKIAADRPGPEIRASLKLSDYFLELLKIARASGWGISLIVVFLDQLERTFESGDEPELDRLKTIASEVKELLADVGVGRGIRVFIASRKQYLPDFLHSWQDAVKSGLHFNVLQSLTEASDQKGFVNDVHGWCRSEQLIDDSVRFDPEAAYELAKKVAGHPLNMMLAMIQLLSEHRTGRITRSVLDVSRPWERLFGFDERIMAKSNLDWYLILAMAHARTEIVRFEEVWWRLRLVTPDLSKQVERLGKTRFVERLWLLGHLGRTIHARPYEGESFGFLEFFHANLRDYLLRDVMSSGTIAVRSNRRHGGTPPAWRALDRLRAAAHDWEQIQQALAADDVQSLMEHRAIVIEKLRTGADGQDDTFSLLFVRDSRELRSRLCQAAKECFVFSALLHDNLGRWAFQEVFPDSEARVECCQRWLQRCGAEARASIVQYLIQAQGEDARKYVVDLVLADADRGSVSWRDVAAHLSEPLMAARFRTDVAVSVLETLGEGGLAREEKRIRFREFAAIACADDANDLMNLLVSCAHRLEGSPRQELRRVGERLLSGGYVEPPAMTTPGGRDAVGHVELRRTGAPIQMVAGAELGSFLTHARAEQWRTHASEELGIPLPPLELIAGDVDPSEIELRVNGRRIARTEVYPVRRRILKRHWSERHASFAAPDAFAAHDDALVEVVWWLDEGYLAQIGWDGPSATADDAAQTWLTEELRQHADVVIDLDVTSEFFKETEAAADIARVFESFPLQSLMWILRHLVRERVPLAGAFRRESLIQALGDVAGERNDIVLQKVREHFAADLCKVHTDRSGGPLFSITLESDLEDALAGDGSSPLRVSPALAQSLAFAVRRHVDSTLADTDVLPVVMCSPALRLPLFRLLERFESRVAVLSTSEIPPDIAWINAGRLGGESIERVAKQPA